MKAQNVNKATNLCIHGPWGGVEDCGCYLQILAACQLFSLRLNTIEANEQQTSQGPAFSNTDTTVVE